MADEDQSVYVPLWQYIEDYLGVIRCGGSWLKALSVGVLNGLDLEDVCDDVSVRYHDAFLEF